MNGPEILIPLVFFVGFASVFIAHITSRHRERMSMIEKGLSSDEIKALFTREIKRDPLTSLKWGLLLVFVGLAALIGNYIHEVYNMRDEVMGGLICLFAGIALLIYYAIASKRNGNG